MKFLLLVFVRRHALEPGQGRYHREHQMQFGVLGHLTLHKHRRCAGIHPSREPIDDSVVGILVNGLGFFVVGRKRVIVRNEKEALVFMLQLYPVVQYAVQVA